MLKQVEDKLEALANKPAWADDPSFNVWLASDGHCDDAYLKGTEDGMIVLARELLAMIREVY
jgi:hypothetical protein